MVESNGTRASRFENRFGQVSMRFRSELQRKIAVRADRFRSFRYSRAREWGQRGIAFVVWGAAT